MKKGLSFWSLALLAMPLAFSCKKTNDTGTPGNGVIPPATTASSVNYGDTVFYLNSQSSDYIINPAQVSAGQYIGFPEGLDIDPVTGAIDVSKSDAGLKYLISFIPQGKTDTVNSELVIGGINYLDGFYILANGDSIVHPLYNAIAGNPIPGINNGTTFDEGGHCNDNGCHVEVGTGIINLAQTVRNGVFGASPKNNDREQFELDYRINDKSGKALNTLQVKLYYFETMNDVTQDVRDLIASREGTILGAPATAIPGIHTSVFSTSASSTTTLLQKGKPRPPCIFIVGH